ncbi:MAG: hypothetical protein LBQ22_09935 [Bacteroidales bacterium]|jgi:gamma-glutamylcyclotransferase (GGCT)/AIG2-like uncharacterized protein YtfP|nr:hypothetical protein [Bacteroidales bacterium]
MEDLQEKQPVKNNDKTTKILIALISVMIIAIGVMGYMLYDMKKLNTQMMSKNQEVTIEKETLKRQLTDLLDDYDELSTSNDSLNSEIIREKEHIQTLIKELEGVRNYNYSIQKKYEEELASLRKIMRGYVYQIDSLDQLNKQLIAENVQVKQAHSRIKDEMDLVVERNDELELAIEEASIVKTAGIGVKFLNKKNKEVNKPKRAERIQVNFTLVSNDLAESGARRIYLRIIRPDGYALTDGNTFEFREKNIVYSAYRDVTYEKQDLGVAIYYDMAETFIPGKYNIELYMSGNLIGQTFFTIEK